MPIPEAIQCYHLSILFSLALDWALPMNSVFLFVGGFCLFLCVVCFCVVVLVSGLLFWLFHWIVTAAEYAQVPPASPPFVPPSWLGFLH